MLDPNYEYRAVVRVGAPAYKGRATVAINSNCYYTKTIAFAQELFNELFLAIPFPFSVENDPEIAVLGGPRVNGMLSVGFRIGFSIPNEEAQKMFKKAGFWDHLECYK